MDAAFSFVFDGVQHNVLASKVMGLERLDLSIGPLSLEVVEPLQTLRIACDDQESGVSRPNFPCVYPRSRRAQVHQTSRVPVDDGCHSDDAKRHLVRVGRGRWRSP